MHFVLAQESGRLSFERQHVECQKYEHGTQPGTIAFVIFICKDKCFFLACQFRYDNRCSFAPKTVSSPEKIRQK